MLTVADIADRRHARHRQFVTASGRCREKVDSIRRQIHAVARQEQPAKVHPRQDLTESSRPTRRASD
jgi:hypothetical protein